MENILDKTERVLRLRNYSSKTRKAYLLYIGDYIKFSKKSGIKHKQKAIEKFPRTSLWNCGLPKNFED